MDDKIIQDKIERSLEIICPLYRENLITDAYIIGSVAKIAKLATNFSWKLI